MGWDQVRRFNVEVASTTHTTATTTTRFNYLYYDDYLATTAIAISTTTGIATTSAVAAATTTTTTTTTSATAMRAATANTVFVIRKLVVSRGSTDTAAYGIWNWCLPAPNSTLQAISCIVTAFNAAGFDVCQRSLKLLWSDWAA